MLSLLWLAGCRNPAWDETLSLDRSAAAAAPSSSAGDAESDLGIEVLETLQPTAAEIAAGAPRSQPHSGAWPFALPLGQLNPLRQYATNRSLCSADSCVSLACARYNWEVTLNGEMPPGRLYSTLSVRVTSSLSISRRMDS